MVKSIVYLTGRKEWYINGIRHRIDGPALERGDGRYLNGICHRENGPAWEDPYNGKIWYRYGILHRTDGPAVEKPNGEKEWWVHGKQINTELILKAISQLKKRYFTRRVLIGMQKARLLRELRLLPPLGIFPGGSDYIKALKSFNKTVSTKR